MPADRGGAADPTFITATPAQGGDAARNFEDVARFLELPRDERLANLERFARCITVRFRRRKPSQDEKDLQMLMPSSLAQSPEVWEYTSCAICLCEFAEGEELRRAPCAGAHAFHPRCLRDWLDRSHATCPVCRGGMDGDDGRAGRKTGGGARFSADALAEFVTRRMRSTKVDFSVSKVNHDRADNVMKQMREPMPCLKPAIEHSEEPSSSKKVQKEDKDLVSIFSARQAARKAESKLQKALEDTASGKQTR